MQSHRPIILFNLLPLVNSDFADGTLDGWDIATLSVNGDQLIRPAALNKYIINPRSTNRTMRQNVTAATVGNKAICAQRLAVSDLAEIISFHNGYMAAAAMIDFIDGKAQTNSTIELQFYSSGTSTVGNGTLITPDDEDKVIYYLESDWGLIVHKVRVPSNAVWAEVRLVYEIADVADYDAASYTHWTNVYVGGMLDMINKGFSKISVKPDLGTKTNIGDGVSEVVRVAAPSGELRIDVKKVMAGTPVDRDIQAMLDSMAIDSPQGCAIWASRLLHTSRGRHFSNAILDSKSPTYEYPPGVTMRHYKFKFDLPTEF